MNFFKHFIKSTKHTGAISQSSRFLAKKMVRNNLDGAKTIVELGPGLGAFTKKIIEDMPTQSSLLTVEINKEFVDHLNKKYPEAKHIHGDIKNLKKTLKDHNVDKADVVISGIPFTVYKKSECDAMFREINDIMHKDSRLVLFTYSPIRFSNFFSWFQKIEVCYVPLNIPPAYVVTLRKK